ncbi:trifunctional serine/threonine-protein kinase/ATP-binding protein/sensor histidine kinase [Cupriavidus sp. YAF13]|uniref:trifunctional serine/threonine-protein kinase/ATP-binding protein/sensor histidine kinase n=1 Tax=Cupriavidus sp. YAF13 TaxID=3233075 RepID=UPI003F91EADA
MSAGDFPARSDAQPGSERSVVTLSDYLFTPVKQDGILALSRGRHQHVARTILLAHAATADTEVGGEAERQLNHEFALRDLLDGAWALKPHTSVRRHAGVALVYDDLDATPLSLLPPGPQPVARLLSIAVGAASALRSLHETGLVHQAIMPSNLFVDDTGHCRIGGFGLATRQQCEIADTLPPHLHLAGEAPAYMSPEHTGRTRHVRDARSDLYSLGVTLYKLATGHLPFVARVPGDLSEWAHCHIASEPVPPHVQAAAVPEALSLLILKLLAKRPARRYQSAAGLEADLRRCRTLWDTLGRIDPFELGTHDQPAELELPGRLYAREAELAMLQNAFDYVAMSGNHALAVVTGTSGIGKSALLETFLQGLRQRPACCAAGKGDQFRREVPYTALAEAFQGLVLEILGQPDAAVRDWQQQVSQALGPYGQLAVNMIPALELLAGKLPPVATSTGPEAQEHFHMAMHNLVNAFARYDRPLVLLVDDLQWLDAPSLSLLEHLLANPSPLPLLLVASSREATAELGLQVPPGTPEPTHARLRRKAARVYEVALAELDVNAITTLVADTLRARRRDLQGLAALIHAKTLGNPFFVGQFLKTMVDDRLIVRRPDDANWHFDLEGIRRRDYTDNVAGMVLRRLERLPARTRTLLGGMACLGRHSDIALLCAIYGIDGRALHAVLAPAHAIDAVHQEEQRYAFFHDRVQEAAHGLLSPAERKRIYLSAGRLLARAAQADDRDEPLFHATELFAQAAELVADAGEAIDVARLSLQAARRAKRAIAYASAVTYLDSGLSFLRAAAASGSEVPAPLMFALMQEQAECEFLLGNLARALDLALRLLAMPATAPQRAAIHQLKTEIHTRRSENALAVETAVAGLQAFGIRLAAHPPASACDTAYLDIRARLAGSALEALLDLPPMSNPDIEAAMALLAALSAPASFTDEHLFFLHLCEMLRLTLEHGMTGASTAALSWFGVLVGHRFEDYQEGFRYGHLARELVSRHSYLAYEAKTLLPLDQLSVWTHPLSFSIDCARAGFSAGVANGDITTACFECCHQVANLLTRGDTLDEVLAEVQRGLDFVRRAGFQDVEEILLLQQHFVDGLRQPHFPLRPAAPALLDDLGPSRTSRERMSTLDFWHWIYLATTRYMAGNYDAAAACQQRAAALAWSAPGHIHLLDFHLYSALTLAATARPGALQYTAQRERLMAHSQKIDGWAAANPATFADKSLLVQAEIARLDGDTLAALSLFEKAIWRADEQGFIQYSALAHELAARLCAGSSFQTAAQAHARAARDAYRRWGATGKVAQLESMHAGLADSSPQKAYALAGSPQIRDVESVIRSARALTEEIHLDKLVDTLMTIALEHAAAQRGLLIRLHGRTPIIEARAHTTSSGILVELAQDAPGADDLPISMLNTVVRTGQRIIVDDASGPNPFAIDSYFHQQAHGSAMCIPMLKRNELIGVLYLENRLIRDSFTVAHTRVLELLAAQAAISLETARLYDALLAENARRERVERAMRASEASLVMGERMSHTGSWRWDLRQNVFTCSEELCRIFEFDAAQSVFLLEDFAARIHPDDRAVVLEMVDLHVAEERPIRVEYRIVRSDGEIRYLASIGKPLSVDGDALDYVGTVTDVTMRRQAEDALRNAQADLARVARATTVGQLTASIAHEINQPLMSIVSNAGASLRWLDRAAPEIGNAREGLVAIASEGQRAGDMIRSLQALTRNAAPVLAAIDMHEAIRHILAIARSEIERRQVSLQLAMDAPSSQVFGDGVQIQQVLLNLVINAVEAMSEVTDRLRMLRVATDIVEGVYLQVSVEDTGTGMSNDAIKHAFEPFYTTKINGMGMGLAICRSIVEAHNGRLYAAPRLPHGCVFAFVIPLCMPKPAADQGTASEARRRCQPPEDG